MDLVELHPLRHHSRRLIMIKDNHLVKGLKTLVVRDLLDKDHKILVDRDHKTLEVKDLVDRDHKTLEV